MNLCKKCRKETKNPSFCCRSCAASFNGAAFPKRKLTRVCLDCSKVVKSYRHYRCAEHLEEYKRIVSESYRKFSIGEYRNKLSVKGKHPSWLGSHIRNFARSWLKHLTKEPCRKCGYNKHVELAHIRSVSSYPDTALIGDINSEDNVIPLCPNCHWEFDNLPRV